MELPNRHSAVTVEVTVTVKVTANPQADFIGPQSKHSGLACWEKTAGRRSGLRYESGDMEVELRKRKERVEIRERGVAWKRGGSRQPIARNLPHSGGGEILGHDVAGDCLAFQSDAQQCSRRTTASPVPRLSKTPRTKTIRRLVVRGR